MGFRCPSTENHFSSMNELFCQALLLVLCFGVKSCLVHTRARSNTQTVYYMLGSWSANNNSPTKNIQFECCYVRAYELGNF